MLTQSSLRLGASSLNGVPRSPCRIPSNHALSIPDAHFRSSNSSKRHNRPCHRWVCTAIAQAAEPSPSAAVTPPSSARLDDLDLLPVISVQGFVNIDVPPGTEATVFAIYDQAKTLQYIGFSKNLRGSLLTVFSRRPDKCHLYRAMYLPTMDQQQMLEVRTRWFEQNGGPPPGNKLAAERAAWQEPATPFVLSERGLAAAAEELAKQSLVKIKARGCKEEFLVNQDLLQQGKVDFLAAAELSPEELERQRREAEAAASLTRPCSVIIDGEEVAFDLFFKSKVATNGGYMFDVKLTANDRETSHRIIVGKRYYENDKLEPELVVERVFSYLLAKEVPRETSGMLLSSDFPIRYFAVSEVHQFFDDFEEFFGQGWLQGTPNDFWRFNRVQDYGMWKGEDVKALSAQFKRGLKDQSMGPVVDDSTDE